MLCYANCYVGHWPFLSCPDLSSLFIFLPFVSPKQSCPDLSQTAPTCPKLSLNSWSVLTSPYLSWPVLTCSDLSWPVLDKCFEVCRNYHGLMELFGYLQMLPIAIDSYWMWLVISLSDCCYLLLLSIWYQPKSWYQLQNWYQIWNWCQFWSWYQMLLHQQISLFFLQNCCC